MRASRPGSGFGCTRAPARPWRRFTGRIWTRTWPSWPAISSRRRRAAAPARRPATPSAPGGALALLAYEEAARLFRMALAVLGLARPPGQDQARCRLLVALGDALTRMGEREAAREELLRAAGIARRYRMAEELGQAALAYA